MKKSSLGLLAVLVLFAFLYGPSPALAQVAPSLGAAASYTVLGTNSTPTSGTVTCTNSTINGKVGTTASSITNTGPCTITGGIDAPVAGSVVTDFNNAYSSLPGMNPCGTTLSATPATMTLAPGVYCFTAGATMTSVTFTLNGSSTDVWVFRVGTGGTGALTGTSFIMNGTAQACNVYWWTKEAATMTDSTFKGTILSGTAITVTRGTYDGRALATTDVTVTNSGGAPAVVTGCSVLAPTATPTPIPATPTPIPATPTPIAPGVVPTLEPSGLALLVIALAAVAFLVLRRNP